MSLDLYKGGVYIGSIDSIDLGAAGISATVSAGRAQFRAAPSVHDNNQNVDIQRDTLGKGENIAYLTDDNTMFFGPGDRPDINIAMNSLLNWSPRHWWDDFFGKTLSHEWTLETTGDAGVSLGDGDTYAHLWTGASGGVVKLQLEGTRDKVGWGSRLYFYAIPGMSPGASIFLGYANEDGSEAVGYERRGNLWYGITRSGGAETVTPMSIAGIDWWRRMWLVDMKPANAVAFWRSTDEGKITKRETLVTTLPPGYLSPTIELSADGATAMDVDLVYSIRNR